MSKKINAEYVRSGLFGFEDSLISTTGLVIGLYTSNSPKNFIVSATLVAVTVAALSAASSELISDGTIQQIKSKLAKDNPLLSSFIMFLTYLFAGTLPILPLFLWDLPVAILGVVLTSICGFIFLGIIRGRFTHRSVLNNILQVLIVGGIAAALGVLVGIFLKQ